MLEKNETLSSLSNLKWGAHHPHCNKHNHHLIRFLNHPFCIGCTFMSIGIFSGIILYVFTSFKNWSPLYLWILGFILYLSAMLQTFTKNKQIKIILRYSLGLGTFFLLISVYQIKWNTSGIILKVVLLIIFVIIFQKTIEFRSKKIDDTCINCQDGTYPLCRFKLNEMKLIIANNNGKTDNKELVLFLKTLIDQFEGRTENSVFFQKET